MSKWQTKVYLSDFGLFKKKKKVLDVKFNGGFLQAICTKWIRVGKEK